MSLFIRCEWISLSDRSIDERIADVAILFANPGITTLVGNTWYCLAGSKREALTKTITTEALGDMTIWKRTRLIEDQYLYALNLWNGMDFPGGVNVSVTLNSPQTDLDTFVISSLNVDYLISSGITWESILLCVQTLSNDLGGMALVSSHELLDQAEEAGLEGAEHAAYAAYWGIDETQRHPAYLGIDRNRTQLPFSMVASDSWADVQAPELGSIEKLIGLLKVAPQ